MKMDTTTNWEGKREAVIAIEERNKVAALEKRMTLKERTEANDIHRSLIANAQQRRM